MTGWCRFCNGFVKSFAVGSEQWCIRCYHVVVLPPKELSM